MKESFLHFVWQHQYFDKSDLSTIEGDKVDIIEPGFLNPDAGPDFPDSRVKLNGLEWAGSTEIHITSSDWKLHKHHLDRAYDNVVLHVVWEYNDAIDRTDGSRIPTIELKGRINKDLLQRYELINESLDPIPCSPQLHEISLLTKISTIEKTAVRRLERKTAQIHEWLEVTHGDWNEVAYRLLSRNFGFKINAVPFLQLSKNLPYKILARHLDDPVKVEALLFGQAGFLSGSVADEYFRKLKSEYTFMSRKYELQTHIQDDTIWKFSRTRPANFPTLRLAQLGGLLIKNPDIFSQLLKLQDIASLRELFNIRIPDYWKDHSKFGKTRNRAVSLKIGRESIENIVINTIAPLLVSYGKSTDTQKYIDQAVKLLEQIKPERNKILYTWTRKGIKAANAFESQGLIELFNEYCKARRCLNCTIGQTLLKN